MVTSFKDFAQQKLASRPKRPKSVWRGPEVDGITQSMIGGFLSDRERFRLRVVEGLQPIDGFDHRMEYGHMFHRCDEVHAANGDWRKELRVYAKELVGKYQASVEQITHWMNVCDVQFAEYLRFWSKRERAEKLDAVGQEQVFDTPYPLPSGRVVRLRGKRDGVYKRGKLFTLRETKTKGDVKIDQLTRQLTFDLQTMLYSITLAADEKITGPVRVVYNVVRRALSGGKGSIKQHAPTKKNPRGESAKEFYARLAEVIHENSEDMFHRFEFTLQPHHMTEFKEQCLTPLLEEICAWWYEINPEPTGELPPTGPTARHWRHPYGVRNWLDEGGATELDNYLATGSMVGLKRVDSLFEEL